ncbi:MAG: hypothetical protein ACRC8S_02170 [Fimbriiglobus sp.]
MANLFSRFLSNILPTRSAQNTAHAHYLRLETLEGRELPAFAGFSYITSNVDVSPFVNLDISPYLSNSTFEQYDSGDPIIKAGITNIVLKAQFTIPDFSNLVGVSLALSPKMTEAIQKGLSNSGAISDATLDDRLRALALALSLQFEARSISKVGKVSETQFAFDIGNSVRAAFSQYATGLLAKSERPIYFKAAGAVGSNGGLAMMKYWSDRFQKSLVSEVRAHARAFYQQALFPKQPPLLTTTSSGLIATNITREASILADAVYSGDNMRIGSQPSSSIANEFIVLNEFKSSNPSYKLVVYQSKFSGQIYVVARGTEFNDPRRGALGKLDTMLRDNLENAALGLAGLTTGDAKQAISDIATIKSMYGGNVTLVSHSQSAVHMTMAGIAHGMRVINFNPLGLHQSQIEFAESQSKIYSNQRKADVTNFVVKGEVLSNWNVILKTNYYGKSYDVAPAKFPIDSSWMLYPAADPSFSEGPWQLHGVQAVRESFGQNTLIVPR